MAAYHTVTKAEPGKKLRHLNLVTNRWVIKPTQKICGFGQLRTAKTTAAKLRLDAKPGVYFSYASHTILA